METAPSDIFDIANSVKVTEVLYHCYQIEVAKNKNFKAPWRNDTNASVCICKYRNGLYDFGRSEYISPVDLVMKAHNCNAYEAAQYICSVFSSLSKPISDYAHPKIDSREEKDENIFVVAVGDLYCRTLLDYSRSRGVKDKVIKRYCKIVWYKYGDKALKKPYFAIGLPNASGGYSLRNPIEKRCTTSDISLIRDTNKKNETVVVVEGMFDFLSWKSNDSFSNFEADFIVLNSTSNTAKAINEIKSIGYKKIYIVLDNDPTGRRYTDIFKLLGSEAVEVVDYTERIRKGFPELANKKFDFNDFHLYLLGKRTLADIPEIDSDTHGEQVAPSKT